MNELPRRFELKINNCCYVFNPVVLFLKEIKKIKTKKQIVQTV